MTNKTKIRKKIESDPDFIYCPRLSNSLKIFLEKYPEGVDNSKISKLLLIEEEEVEKIYSEVIEKIRKNIKLK